MKRVRHVLMSVGFWGVIAPVLILVCGVSAALEAARELRNERRNFE